MAKPRDRSSRQETRRIDELVPFPDQATIFENLAIEDLQSLADNIRRNGLQSPVHVLPKNDAGFEINTILDGHQRVAALKMLGWTEVAVVVRHDLAHSTREQIEEQFAGPNLDRRHMTSLQRLRAWLYFYERKTGRKVGDPAKSTDKEFLAGARQCVGLTASDRNLRRLLKTVSLPLLLQRRVDREQLRTTYAERVWALSNTHQEEIIKRIEAGEAPNSVVPEYFADRRDTVRIDQEVDRAMGQLRHITDRLAPRLSEMEDFGLIGAIPSYRRTIAESRQLLTNLEAELQRMQR